VIGRVQCLCKTNRGDRYLLNIYRRGRAAIAATKAVTDLVRAQETHGGIPPFLWKDSYVLGYLGGTINTMAQIASGDKLSRHNQAWVAKKTFQDVFGSRGEEIWQSYLAANDPVTEDLLDGIRKSSKVCLMIYGSHEFDNDEDVLDARRIAATVGVDVAVILMTRYFLEEIADRFA
jgi:hypothetical protein